ncbi:MAG TPA: Rne/Rng family ribonuclease [Gaiellaceae bacterium]|nr:Rne/Rng family ribonuclease [Gaiellaceae bacterium]
MRWFRKRKDEERDAPVTAAPVLDEPAQPAVAPDGESAADGQVKPRRRRGSRGGRGRKKKPAEAGSEAKAADEPQKPKQDAAADGRPKPAKKEPARGRQRSRRREPRRVELPPVRKELYISVEVGEKRVALLEDGKVAEVYLERRGRRSIAGNVYKGVVDNVLPGMEASFVDIGLAKNGFLYVDEIVVPELEGKQRGRKIQDLIQRGEEVLVQAVKDPMGTKGARLTTEVSLPGRFLVYVPYGEGIGISRRLEDAERERLKAISKGLELPEGGIIVRTAAEGASKEELAGDLAFLQKLWATIKGRAGRTKAPALVYQEAELPLRVIRDLMNRDIERVVVDHDRTYRRILSYLKRTSPELTERVELYEAKQPLMEKVGVDEAVRSTLNRRVDLPSGGYLIFDYAEAFTVVDVNTGRFVGSRSRTSGARLEDTITKNNLEAVEEVVRQLRLRDIGGIIVIDFIDMANPKNRQSVEGALRRELERDRTKTYVVEISPLGLVEMTRQNVTDGPREILTVACPTCLGDGIVISHETHAIQAERRLRALTRETRHQAYRVELNAHVGSLLVGAGGARLGEIEEETGRRFFLELRADVPADHFEVLERGPVSKIAPSSLPVEKGEELEVRLAVRHEHRPADAVARLNGYVVNVAGGADRLGKTVKVRVQRVGTQSAYAVLVDVPKPEPPVDPETALEAEASEDGAAPKRRSRRGGRGRGARKAAEAAPPAEAVGPEEEPAEPDAAPEEPAVAAGVEPEPDQPKRKRRRGSRGGRGRKKKAAEPGMNAEATEQPGEAEAPPDAARPAATAPPDADSDSEPKPPKKTRRGSRGGRNRRRRRPAEAAAESAGTPEEEPVTFIAPAEESG